MNDGAERKADGAGETVADLVDATTAVAAHEELTPHEQPRGALLLTLIYLLLLTYLWVLVYLQLLSQGVSRP
jgi:hypothetical protein